MSYKKNTYYDRRKGPDLWVKLLNWLTFTCWILMALILFLIDRAEPPMETFFDRLFEIQVRQTWNVALLQYAFYLMITLCIFCTLGLLIHSRRHRRKTDTHNFSLILLLFLGLISMGIYLTKF